ncbi:MAG: ribosomal-protein-alanine N-acetyltransferase [Zetaproteobacteria bacterium]|nr:MAG: ribosomal-protein-alanine N-acetyltransferase [Zetaproteobacteria bacterium]
MTEPSPDTPQPHLVIEPMRRADLPDVLAIEVASFSLPWTEEMFATELTPGSVGGTLVARMPAAGGSPAVVGYVCTWVVGDELHINNLAVHPRWRQRGIGRDLLCASLRQGRGRGARSAFLEVRTSNAAAQALYRQFGFEPVAVRRRYYTHPLEDAIVMRRTGL